MRSSGPLAYAHGSVGLAMLFACVLSAQTSNDPVPQLRNVKIEQKLNSQVPLDLQFRDETGRTVTLREMTAGRPTVLALVYYQCPRLCSMILTGTLKAARALAFNAGREYDILAISFDPRETPTLASAKKQVYVDSYNRPGTAQGWHFLTGNKREIDRLTHAVGFGFDYDDRTDQFSHASAIMVLTPGGRVAKYFYGVEYSARDLRLGLVEAAQGKIGTPVDQLLLYCFHYDAATGTYSMTIMRAIRIGGIVTVVFILAAIVFATRRDRNRRSHVLHPEVTRT